VPGLGHPLGCSAEQTCHEASLVQVVFELLLVEGSRAHVPEDVDDPEQRAEVRQADDDQERSRDERPGQTQSCLQGRVLVLDRAGQRADPDRE